MIYLMTDVTERIYMHNDCDKNDVHCIMLTKSGEEPVFYVHCCCDEDWVWEFYMDNASNYEMVKHMVMDTMFECEDIEAVICELDEVFADIFDDIVVWDVDNDNNNEECCCERCNHRDCLN